MLNKQKRDRMIFMWQHIILDINIQPFILKLIHPFNSDTKCSTLISSSHG